MLFSLLVELDTILLWCPSLCVLVHLHLVPTGVNFTNILCAAFFVQTFCPYLFCTDILGLNFFWRKNNGANALIKCWWNWPQVDDVIYPSFPSLSIQGMHYVTDDRQSFFSRISWLLIVVISFILAGISIKDSFNGKKPFIKITCHTRWRSF